MNIVLASASERRQELLKRILGNFDIIVSNFDEDTIKFSGDPEEYVKALAYAKANQVAEKMKSESLVIGSDTIVYQDGRILGKPKDYKDAYSMLKALSGSSHKVYSGIAVVNSASKKIITAAVCTEVFFSELTEEQIKTYIESGEPMDKAGAYGIQGNGGVFVEKIHGCYYNVVGLPINRLYYVLKEMGVNL
ncbi:Maf-like protein [Clostridium swellfunianum]|uniref:Maf-like protein n=1 Tax=Clostridium swellfunianum TaxID=1367462 RepID=UPI00202FD8C4|nr:Maf-like protein [Clostridium swellfunianum]MCM0648965.1 Maf-like protein [Clostridium swellfunianum]